MYGLAQTRISGFGRLPYCTQRRQLCAPNADVQAPRRGSRKLTFVQVPAKRQLATPSADIAPVPAGVIVGAAGTVAVGGSSKSYPC